MDRTDRLYDGQHLKRMQCKECGRLTLYANSEPEPNSGCWIWLAANHGATSKRDALYGHYGKIGGQYAHRWAYRLCVGPIPHGLQIDHRCRNKSCVNPAHLEAVTLKENLRRANTRALCPRGHVRIGSKCKPCHAAQERQRRQARAL